MGTKEDYKLLRAEVEADLPKIIKLAEHGHGHRQTKAQLYLGSLYHAGMLVPQSDDEARRWYLKAAKQNSAEALYKVGETYRYGDFEKKAVAWYQQSAEQGYIKAHTQLSSMYMFGRGVEKCEHTAFRWTEKAAKLGDRGSEYELAGYYHHGFGAPYDLNKAIAWYQKAAQQGHRASQYELALIYSEGGIIPVDLVKAYAYAIADSKNGYKGAVELKDELVEKMTPEQIAAAEALAKRCIESDYKDCE
jgi:TPR repeat protein